MWHTALFGFIFIIDFFQAGLGVLFVSSAKSLGEEKYLPEFSFKMSALCHISILVCLSIAKVLCYKWICDAIGCLERSFVFLQNKVTLLSLGCDRFASFLLASNKLVYSLASNAASVKMSETIFENLEKMGKKQSKEQVPPPPAETQQKKQNTAKQSKKSQPNTSSKPTHYKTLEEAVKAVSRCHNTHEYQHFLYM